MHVQSGGVLKEYIRLDQNRAERFRSNQIGLEWQYQIRSDWSGMMQREAPGAVG